MELTNDQRILQSIVQKAWRDPVFKNNLLQNPVAAVESFLGHPINLPEGKKISFVDQTDTSTIFITIPAEPDIEDMELDEELLDMVSGGENLPPVIVKPANYDGNGNLLGGNQP
ncbi:hypothetical protein HNP38_002685 [Chryseobacterium defluvii]|uniref:Uncharacterized protein n=1 Tax=Chryseobacterium defluvii TaxID=160396 RepID=A0A840KDB0_9FLAO|nr:NHLP leader peptide family RiPP precursor [Chryseobacterium defluvii]MBB4807381.1 hypothetical protein [Chryseobacterium defluvii]